MGSLDISDIKHHESEQNESFGKFNKMLQNEVTLREFLSPEQKTVINSVNPSSKVTLSYSNSHINSTLKKTVLSPIKSPISNDFFDMN